MGRRGVPCRAYKLVQIDLVFIQNLIKSSIFLEHEPKDFRVFFIFGIKTPVLVHFLKNIVKQQSAQQVKNLSNII